MDIAEAEQCHFVRFRFLAVDWIPEEQQYINFIAGNASCNLLIAALSAAEITLDFQTGCFTDQFSGCTGRTADGEIKRRSMRYKTESLVLFLHHVQ